MPERPRDWVSGLALLLTESRHVMNRKPSCLDLNFGCAGWRITSKVLTLSFAESFYDWRGDRN
jgi:hypothetical protein